MPKPISRQEAIAIGDSQYFTGKPCPHGHVVYRYVSNCACTECGRIVSRARTRWLRKNNPQYVMERNAYQRKLKQSAEYVRMLRARERARYETDPTFVSKKKRLTRAWRSRNLPTIVARNAERRALLQLRMPQWADKLAIRAFYRNRPTGWHVDHIIPLNGSSVSGLHVLANLQYLPASENLKKGIHYGDQSSTGISAATFDGPV